MSNYLKIYKILILLSFCALFGFAAFSGQEFKRSSDTRSHRRAFFSENNLFDARFVLKWKEKINLSKKQKEQLENLVLKREEFYIRHSAEIKVKEIELATYLKSPKIVRKEVEKLIKAISAIKTNLIIFYTNYLLDVRDLLIPSQLEILKKNKKK